MKKHIMDVNSRCLCQMSGVTAEDNTPEQWSAFWTRLQYSGTNTGLLHHSPVHQHELGPAPTPVKKGLSYLWRLQIRSYLLPVCVHAPHWPCSLHHPPLLRGSWPMTNPRPRFHSSFTWLEIKNGKQRLFRSVYVKKVAMHKLRFGFCSFRNT